MKTKAAETVRPAAAASGALGPDLRLGYVGMEVKDLDAWERFGREAIGFHVERREGLLMFRMDDRQARFIIWQGPLDDVAYIGWEADHKEDLDKMHDRLGKLRIACEDIDTAGLKQRGVARGFRFTGPAALPFEIFTDPMLAATPLRPNRTSGFVAGKSGIGHIAVQTHDLQALADELERMLGIRHTDDINARLDGIELELKFYHISERHHSVALCGLKRDVPLLPKRLDHIMLEVPTLEDVGAANVRCKAMGYTLPMDIGQHPNDRSIGFYVVNPSGFKFEIGWDHMRIRDESSWKPAVYDLTSLWGHAPFDPSISRGR